MIINKFKDYLLLEKKYSLNTVNAYCKDVEVFFEFSCDKLSHDDLTSVMYFHIRSWIISLVEKGVSNRTINRKVSSLSAFYKFLLKVGEIKTSPLVKHKSLKVEKKSKIPFSESEVQNVLKLFRETPKGFSDLRDRLILEMLYSTGVRRAELININVSDVNFYKGELKVLGKRGKERIIPVLNSTLELMKLYQKSFEEKFGRDFSGCFFVTDRGDKIYENFVFRLVNRYFSKVSVKKNISPHVLRHSFATHLLNNGADLNSVKELLGHSSLAATQVYTHNNIYQLAKVYRNSHPRNK